MGCARETLEHWINILHPDTDDSRRGPGLYVDVTIDDDIFVDELSEAFCQLQNIEESKKASTVNSPVLTINPDHWMTRWMVREGEDSARPIAWAVLGAYAHINNMLEVVTNDHELICQQRVAGALAEGRLTMIRRTRTQNDEEVETTERAVEPAR